MRRKFWLIFFLIISFNGSEASVIQTAEKEIISEFGKEIEVYIDESSRLSLDEVQTKSFYPGTQKTPNFGSTSAAIWFKINIKTSQEKWLFEVGNPILEYVDFYYPKDKGYQCIQAGTHLPFESKEFKAKNFLFPLSFDTTSVQTYYLRIQSKTVVHCSMQLGRLHSFLEEYHKLDLYQGIYFGFIILMILYNLIIYLSVRDRAYLYYVGYVLSVGIFVAFINGYAFQYIPFFNNYWKDPVALAAITCVFGVLFTGSFLKTALYAPKLHKGLISLLICLSIVLGIDAIGYAIVSSNFLKAIIFFGAIYIYFVSFVVYKSGYKPARNYIIAWTFILLANVLTSLYYSNLIPASPYIINAIQIGSSVEVILLSLALADRINMYKKEKEIAQEVTIRQLRENEELKNKVTQDLEERVEERTRDLKLKQSELIEANERLKVLTDKLQEMNVRLDIDNWELKKEVKEKTKAIILSEELSYEEFLKVFPDELTCLRFMEEMKWDEGYSCKKCSNKTYCEGIKKFSRKCNRCDYTESVTAFTLFHGLKFPLNKAFYITYLKSLPESNYSIRQLSGILDLTPNTCTAFIKKVEERKAKVLSKSGKRDLEKWESLVLDTLD